MTLREIRTAILHAFGLETREDKEARYARDSQRAEEVNLGVTQAAMKIHEARRHLTRPATLPEIQQ